MAADNYTDVDVDGANAPYAAINAYFGLLPDQEDGQFDGDATISRAQAMAFDHGKGAGDQPSYAVYMKEGDPLYGTIYHVGDYLPDGTQLSGTNDEWEA